MNIQKLNEKLCRILKEETNTNGELSNRERLSAYAEHILDALLTLELHYFPSINETQEYEDIKYYAEQLKKELEEGKGFLDEIS